MRAPPLPAPRARSLQRRAGSRLGAPAGHLVREVSPCRPGSAGSRGAGGAGGERAAAPARRLPRGEASWLRLGARRPAAARRLSESGWPGRRDPRGVGSPSAGESGAGG